MIHMLADSAAAALTFAGVASAQSQTEFFLDATHIDVASCVPQNPNCECKPETETCWFKTPDQQFVFFRKDSMKVISKAQYEAD